MIGHHVRFKPGRTRRLAFALLAVALGVSAACQAQYPSGAMANGIETPVLYSDPPPFTRVGLAAKIGTLGAGLEVSTRFTNRVLLHFSGSYLTYNHALTREGIHYTGTIHLRSLQAGVDWFPFRRGFYISPGVLFFGANKATALANVPAGGFFVLDNTRYQSSLTDPIHGNGAATVNSAGPMLTMGFGSVLPRSRRFSVPFEFGAVYDGSPKVVLNLTGSGCITAKQGTFCEPVAQIPGFLDSLAGEQAKLNHDAQPYTIFPIVSLGFAWKF